MTKLRCEKKWLETENWKCCRNFLSTSRWPAYQALPWRSLGSFLRLESSKKGEGAWRERVKPAVFHLLVPFLHYCNLRGHFYGRSWSPGAKRYQRQSGAPAVRAISQDKRCCASAVTWHPKNWKINLNVKVKISLFFWLALLIFRRYVCRFLFDCL